MGDFLEASATLKLSVVCGSLAYTKKPTSAHTPNSPHRWGGVLETGANLFGVIWWGSESPDP